jgi:hypothetical protein
MDQVAAPKRLCTCTHPHYSHHVTPAGRVTWCTVWDPDHCECPEYDEAPGASTPPGAPPTFTQTTIEERTRGV